METNSEPDFKSMYYYLAGRTASTADILETTNGILDYVAHKYADVSEIILEISQTLTVLSEKVKNAQQETEEMFIGA